MNITDDDIENEISFDDPIDNRTWYIPDFQLLDPPW